jgi:polyisoprenoid-binding protein YceI
MKQFLFSALIAFFSLHATAQKYYTSAAIVTFSSDAPMEKIVSKNEQVTAMINTETKDIAFKVIMKSFRFEKQGMYDHFNAKYLETDKFANATFLGKIINKIDLSKNGTYSATVEGVMTIHGVARPLSQTGKIEVADGKITVNCSFSLLLSDYGVKISNDYIKRISNTVQVKVNAALTPYTR